MQQPNDSIAQLRGNATESVSPELFSMNENLPFLEHAPPFIPAFIASLFIIICSEIGDKTFFIAAIMSMKYSSIIVWTGASAALFTMTVLSVLAGYALPALLSRTYTHYASVALFFFFGIQLLREASKEEEGEENEELQEVEMALAKKSDDEEMGVDENHAADGEAPAQAAAGSPQASRARRKSDGKATQHAAKIFWQACTLTFLAEWGDRSQIATIALAAAKEPIGVTLGSCLGHALCTGLAVIGGRLLATSISERMVHLAGGLLFLLFAILGLFFEI